MNTVNILPARVFEARAFIKREIDAARAEMGRTRSENRRRLIKDKKINPRMELSTLLDDLIKENTRLSQALNDREAALARLPETADLNAQILEIERELILRKRVYTSRVRSGKMTPEAARKQYDTMGRALETLKGLKRSNV